MCQVRLPPQKSLILKVFRLILTFLCFTLFVQLTTSSRQKMPSFNRDHLPTCEDLFLGPSSTHDNTSTTTEQSLVIKSLSLYGEDEVVIVYGEESETTSAFVYRYRRPSSFNRSRPLSELGLGKGSAGNKVIVHEPLTSLFPEAKKTIERWEIVSLAYLSDQMAVLFFRSVLEGKTLFLLFNNKNFVQRGQVVTVTGSPSHAVWLAHFGGKANSTVANTLPAHPSTKEASFYAHFITLDDQTHQQGTVRLNFKAPSSSSKDLVPQLSLIVNQSRLLGTDDGHETFYLLLNRSDGQRYADFEPFVTVILSLQNWRALLYGDYVYVLSGGGDGKGKVFYFKPANLTEYYVRATLEQRMGNMPYDVFFGCTGVDKAPGAFPPEFVFVHIDVLVHTRFFIYLLTLLTTFTVLCFICHCFYTPAQDRMFRLTRRPLSNSTAEEQMASSLGSLFDLEKSEDEDEETEDEDTESTSTTETEEGSQNHTQL